MTIQPSDLQSWRRQLGIGVIRAARLIINPATGRGINHRTLQRWEAGEKPLPWWLTRKHLPDRKAP